MPVSQPAVSERTEKLKSSVFAVLAKRLEGYRGKRYPFHIGDNTLAPPTHSQWPNLTPERFGDPYRYGHPNGAMPFREQLAQKLRRQNGMTWAVADLVQISVGATHGLTCAVQALLNPGDEVLLLAPYWPLMRGICHCSAVTPVDVPFYQRLLADPSAEAAALIEPFVTAKTRAIYVITPNNPNGLVLSLSQMKSVAELAGQHGLWLFSDEAYENYVYAGKHRSFATLEGMAERTVSAYTFSKSYAMAGTRVGYVLAPEHAADVIKKVATHSVYNTSQACQAAAMGALENGASFLETARSTYRAYAQIVADNLQAAFHPAQGGSFVFMDLREFGPDALPILEKAADCGVTFTPGAIFGRGFEGYARMCFTATDEDTLREGITIFNTILADARG
jgi:aspartate/methionine/tyrosine aminotransferase